MAADFDPEEAIDALTRIRELNDEVTRHREDFDQKDAKAKAAKKLLEASQNDLNVYIRGLSESHPLFEKAAPEPARKHGPEPAKPDEAWQTHLLSELIPLGVSSKVIDALEEQGLVNIGHVADHTAKAQLTDLKGIGEAKATAIEEALIRWWEAHPEFTRPGANPGPEEEPTATGAVASPAPGGPPPDRTHAHINHVLTESEFTDLIFGLGEDGVTTAGKLAEHFATMGSDERIAEHYGIAPPVIRAARERIAEFFGPENDPPPTLPLRVVADEPEAVADEEEPAANPETNGRHRRRRKTKATAAADADAKAEAEAEAAPTA